MFPAVCATMGLGCCVAGCVGQAGLEFRSARLGSVLELKMWITTPDFITFFVEESESQANRNHSISVEV